MATAYDTANIIIPQGGGYKSGSLYGWNPQDSSLVDFSVARAGATATRVNSSGLIESVAANTPRWDWAEGGSCPSLLVEPQRTNLLLRSEDFTTTWATAVSATVTGNTTAAPDGATTADTISLAAVTDSRVTQTFTLANSTTYTLSCFFKNDSLTAGQTFNFRIANNTVAPNNFQMTATVDLAAGSVVISEAGTAGTGISGTATGGIENYGNGWYRVFVTATTGSGAGTASATVEIISSNARQFFAWGAQLEQGSYATSYIPTAGSTETRNADVISKTAIASLLGDSEGSMYAELMPFTISTIQLYNSASARVWTELDTNSNKVVINNGAGAVTLLNNSTTSPLNVYRKIAWSYAVNAFGMSVNGTDLNVTPTQGTFADGTLSALRFDFGTPFCGRIRSLAIYDIALTQSERENLTT